MFLNLFVHLFVHLFVFWSGGAEMEGDGDLGFKKGEILRWYGYELKF